MDQKTLHDTDNASAEQMSPDQVPSVFTLIINGEIPCHKVYEDELVLAFLDIHPIQPGQVLIVPKRQVAYVWDMTDVEYQAVMMASRNIALATRRVFSEGNNAKKLVAMHIEGLEVAHAHIKLFPFETDAEFRRVPDMQAEPDHQELAAIAKQIANALV